MRASVTGSARSTGSSASPRCAAASPARVCPSRDRTGLSWAAGAVHPAHRLFLWRRCGHLRRDRTRHGRARRLREAHAVLHDDAALLPGRSRPHHASARLLREPHGPFRRRIWSIAPETRGSERLSECSARVTGHAMSLHDGFSPERGPFSRRQASAATIAPFVTSVTRSIYGGCSPSRPVRAPARLVRAPSPDVGAPPWRVCAPPPVYALHHAVCMLHHWVCALHHGARRGHRGAPGLVHASNARRHGEPPVDRDASTDERPAAAAASARVWRGITWAALPRVADRRSGRRTTSQQRPRPARDPPSP
jgi:hypothetical protein